MYILETMLSGRNKIMPEASAIANIIFVGNLKKSARLTSNFIVSLLIKDMLRLYQIKIIKAIKYF